MSLGTAVVTGLKKSSVPHVVSSCCFGLLALLHFLIHRRQLSVKMERCLRLDGQRIRSAARLNRESTRTVNRKRTLLKGQRERSHRYAAVR
jgi:hypothetical protein